MTVCWIPRATGWNWKLQCCSWFLKLWVSVFTPEDEAKTAPVWKYKRPSILWNNDQWPFTIHMCCLGWRVARICITIATGLSTWRYVFTEVQVFWCVVWGTVLILVTVLPAVDDRQEIGVAVCCFFYIAIKQPFALPLPSTWVKCQKCSKHSVHLNLNIFFRWDLF